jgi:uncharacterized protein YbjT (DUF2867 family)
MRSEAFMSQHSNARPILLTGATGYVGSKLLAVLCKRARVRCLVRDPAKLEDASGVEVTQGDLFDPHALARAFAGVETAYYLVHSMTGSDNFESRDRAAATAFVEAAEEAGVRRIIYLGGLGDENEQLSPHLRSRHEVGKVLASRSVECIEFRASLIIGAGSASFELVRDLTERLPVMLAPQWLRTPTQPIGVDDLLAYLQAALDLPEEGSRVFEIGGCDRTTYAGIIKSYAKHRGLTRALVPVPILTPELSRMWLYLVAPREAGVGQSLVGSLRNPTVVRNDAAKRAFPNILPATLDEAMARAVADRIGNAGAA